jgi:predicted ATPase
MTPLVGRRSEVAAAAAMLRQGVRLLTLTGPGGVGKTRLAIEVAASVAGAFADGVAFVELAAVSDPSLIATAIGQTLGIQAGGELPIGADLVAGLRDRHDLLLVLDNFEHVLDAAPFVAELLARCPGLRVLATSRTPLRISGERLLPVPPLGVPDAISDTRRAGPLAAVAASEAVTLFVQRARAGATGFDLTEANAETIAEICRRVDGLPLALELAAARARVLSPAALLARLEPRLPMLADGARDQPERLRTMRAAIAWTHDLLCAAEQKLFRRLAVFAGGFTVEAVEFVGRDTSDPAVMEETSTLDTLEALVDQGMVTRMGHTCGGATKPRFRMLETVREFALERLAAGGDGAATRAAHAEYYLGWVEGIAPDLKEGRHLAPLLDGLEVEHANLRAALEHLIETGDAEASARLAGSLAPFWLFHSHRGEGRRWLARVLALGPGTSVPPTVWVRAVGGAAVLAFAQADYEPAAALAATELALWDELGDRWGGATALNLLGAVARAQGAFDQATVWCEDALDRFREAGDPARVALSLCNLGILAY